MDSGGRSVPRGVLTMCKQLTERAADDLLRWVRFVYREGFRSTANLHVAALGTGARDLLDKHGLLTMADDPEVAAVFMEDEVNPYLQYSDARLALHVEWDSRAAEVWARRYPAGSPARMSYAESEWCSWCGRMTDHRSGFHFSDVEGFGEGERVTLDCVGGLATDPRLDPGTPAEGQRIAHGSHGVVDCAGTHNVGVVFDGYEGSVRVPVSMLRRV
jgi:hypothetical protein